MNDNLAYKINSSFRLLGLKPGADARQIRSAFRRLARTYHPDIAGVFSAKKFEQISNAYLLLKNLTPEELALCEAGPAAGAARESLFDRWRRFRAERDAKREAEARARREAEEAAREDRERALTERVDAILDRCEAEINSVYKRRQDEKLARDISDVVLRLGASRYEVRLMALQNVRKYASFPQISDALEDLLGKYPITGEVLDLIDRLSLPRGLTMRIIKAAARNIKDLDEQEALRFIKRVIFMAAGDVEIISGFMEHPSPRVTELLVARWSFPELPCDDVLRMALSDAQNEKLLVSALNMLKRYDNKSYPPWLTQRINELLSHDAPSVRLCARGLAPWTR